MGAFFILCFLAIAAAIWATVAAILIAIYLEKKGTETPFFLFKFYMFRNQRLYREFTLKESGKVGPLYYQFVIPVNAALILGLAALAIRLL
ncbi:MAG: hypothetical protein MUC72_08290 [Acidobacteria bacterium]|jgi:hypothetical protein|nr:hypothetical protein [Acidobacteriota bacterium]